MADGYRFPQSAGTYYYPQPSHHTRHVARNDSPTIRSAFTSDTPSPSRSPDPQSPAQSLYGMYGQSNHAGQFSRINGAQSRQNMHFGSNPYAHQQPQSSHHQNLQQDHNAHTANGNLGHHTSYTSGALNSSTPTFTPSQLPNGHSGGTRGQQAQQISEHWSEQLALHKECQKANQSMINEHAPNHYARTKGHENRSLPAETAAEDGVEDRGRPSNLQRPTRRQDWHNMDMSGQGLRVLTPPVFAYTFLSELYIASNKIRVLPSSIGELRQLLHLDISHNELTSLPQEIGMCTFLKSLLLFDNKITDLPNSIGYLYQLDMLGIEGNPLRSDLKNQIVEKGTKPLVLQLRESITKEQEAFGIDPNQRDMIDLQDGNISQSNQETFKVLSYNALCHKYATVSQYGYLPSGALAWDWRKNKVLEELRERDADILCLQEIDSHSYNEYFRSELAYNDYRGVFWPKGRARTMSEKDAKIVDGCAIFYKGSKYILLDKQLIDIASIAINRPDMKSQPDMFNRVMPKDHIAVICFLESRLTGSRLIVVNTHLEWSASFADVKIIQTAIILEYLSKAAEKYARWPACKDKKNYGLSGEETNGQSDAPQDPPQEPAPSMEYSSSTQIPLIVCGDLNSLRDSAVYDLLEKGSIDKDHPELAGYHYGNFTRDGIQHPFSLRSSYSHLNGTPNELPFTNYTPGFVGVIDYIWYSNNALEATKLLGPVNPEYLSRVPAFPTWYYPSDHLSLAAEFAVKGTARKEKKIVEPDFGPSSRRRGD